MKKTLLMLFAVMMLISPIIYARTVNIIFEWDKNTEPDLAGYKLYGRTNSTSFTDPNALVSIIVDPNNIPYVLSNFEAIEDTYFAVTAYDDANNESGFSNEVLFDLGPSTPSNFRINVIIDVQVN